MYQPQGKKVTVAFDPDVNDWRLVLVSGNHVQPLTRLDELARQCLPLAKIEVLRKGYAWSSRIGEYIQ